MSPSGPKVAFRSAWAAAQMGSDVGDGYSLAVQVRCDCLFPQGVGAALIGAVGVIENALVAKCILLLAPGLSLTVAHEGFQVCKLVGLDVEEFDQPLGGNPLTLPYGVPFFASRITDPQLDRASWAGSEGQ